MWFTTSFAFCLLAVWVSITIIQNPVLSGLQSKTLNSKDDMKYIIFTKHFVLDAELENLRQHFPEADYVKYRNHCLRVLSFAKHFLPTSVYEVYPNAMNIIAMALAYHDVALWTDRKLNYLEHSVMRMEVDVGKDRIFTTDHVSIAREIILYHHKFTSFHSSNNAAEAMVNAVRKADWADATMGVIPFGLPTDLLELAYIKVPSYGFHAMLAGMGSRLSPQSFFGQFEVLKILKW
jgi:hypothetical protein